MTSRQITGWFNYLDEFPWSYGHALIAASIHNMHLKKDAKPLTPLDFMPAHTKPVDDDFDAAGWFESFKRAASA